ncbi:MAG: spore coat associated protein CotJA [Clostridia bacterium]|nr:spore coat associated protein CotJA [Clostridia bacterium]MBR6554455.1 spore coat associated protein CotJA [Clostridia bacterium]
MLAFEESMFPAKISLAMSYVPNQPFENLYDEKEALAQGTLFRSLNFPFVGGKTR